MKKLTSLIVVFGAAAVLTPTAMPEQQRRPTLTAHASRFGKVLFDTRGFVLYGFTRDHRRSACYGACAKAWPPYWAPKGKLTVGPGVKRSLLGTVKRRNGRRQVTYAGHPLYFYVGDTQPGQILCQDVVEYGGRWLIVRPSGRLLR
jgi:predicted lipoprotein with Yx(FWY)xxD motif